MRCSDFEIEVLQVFWEQGDLTAPEIHEIIQKRRLVAYNTVKTIIDRLEKKGAVERIRQYGRTILFRATVAEAEITRPMVQSMLKRLFGGNRKALMSHLFQDEALSDDEILYLESLLKNHKKGGQP
ncbi:MAG: transcriptional regulator [Acidobacteria bacterium]|nr:MAG: transcriptional regulator [Acidobacteriota bacterium]PIE90947.1 MAG: transcriptional regulator [Acidobacteriota bacterium]